MLSLQDVGQGLGQFRTVSFLRWTKLLAEQSDIRLPWLAVRGLSGMSPCTPASRADGRVQGLWTVRPDQIIGGTSRPCDAGVQARCNDCRAACGGASGASGPHQFRPPNAPLMPALSNTPATSSCLSPKNCPAIQSVSASRRPKPPSCNGRPDQRMSSNRSSKLCN